MNEIEVGELENIREEVQKEFPGDPGLQQIHIARKILTLEAELKGLSFMEYIKLQVKGMNNR